MRAKERREAWAKIWPHHAMEDEKAEILEALGLTNAQIIEELRALAHTMVLERRSLGFDDRISVDDVIERAHRDAGQICPRRDRYGRTLPCQPSCRVGRGKHLRWTGAIFRNAEGWVPDGTTKSARSHQAAIRLWRYTGR